MFSRCLDQLCLVLIAFILLLRLFLEKLLIGFGPLGSGKISNLVISTAIFLLAAFYFFKKIFLKEKIILPRAWAVLSASGFIGTISIFYSVDPPASIHSSLILWSFIFLLAVLINLLDSPKYIQVIVICLIAAALFASLQAIYEYLFQLPWYLAHSTPEMMRDYRDFAQLLRTHRTPTLFYWPNILSGFLMMILPLSGAYVIHARPKYLKILLSSVFFILVYAFFVELTMSCWISLFLAAGFLFIYFKNRLLNPGIYKWMGGGVFIFALLMAIVVVKKISFSSLNSFSSRQEYFTNAFYLIMRHPVIGNGLNSFGVASAPLAKSINSLSNYAHNTYIQILAELGLLGLSAYIAFLVFLWKEAMPLTNENHKKYYWLTFALLAGVIAVVLDNFFSYTMLIPNAALYWWVLIGLLLSLKETLNPSGHAWTAGLRRKILLVTGVLLMGCLSLCLTAAEYDYFTALPYIHDNPDQHKAIALFQKAKGLNLWDEKFDLGEAVAYFELFNSTSDRKFLQLAHESVLKTTGQVSLGAERKAIMDKIEAAL